MRSNVFLRRHNLRLEHLGKQGVLPAAHFRKQTNSKEGHALWINVRSHLKYGTPTLPLHNQAMPKASLLRLWHMRWVFHVVLHNEVIHFQRHRVFFPRPVFLAIVVWDLSVENFLFGFLFFCFHRIGDLGALQKVGGLVEKKKGCCCFFLIVFLIFVVCFLFSVFYCFLLLFFFLLVFFF